MGNSIQSKGVTIGIGNGADPEVFTNIGEVTNAAGPDKTCDTSEDTTLADEWKTFTAALLDGGQVTFDLNDYPSDTGQAQLETDFAARTNRNFKITLTDDSATSITVEAIITALSRAIPLGDKITRSVTLKVSGQPTVA